MRSVPNGRSMSSRLTPMASEPPAATNPPSESDTDPFSDTDPALMPNHDRHVHVNPAHRPPLTDMPLRRDVRMLGFQLGHVLRHHGSEGLYALVERVRQLAKRRRAGSDEADDTLRDVIRGCSIAELDELARALACFFDLANLAEDRHRIRVLRDRSATVYPEPRTESPGAALRVLADAGVSAEEAAKLLEEMCIELVFTAHPTEAKRATVRNTLKRLRNHLVELDRHDLLQRERDSLISHLKTDLDCLWETDTLRPRKPTVLGEVRRSLFVQEPLWQVIPWLYDGLRSAWGKVYPTHPFPDHAFLRFGTWIGGDRDGNPFVTRDVTAQTLSTLREAAIQRHIDAGRELFGVLSISEQRHPVLPEIHEAILRARGRFPRLAEELTRFHPLETYRHFLRVIEHRLEATAQGDPLEPRSPAAYSDASELVADVELIQRSLRANDHFDLAGGAIQAWLDRITVFGFHFASMDIREDAQKLGTACGELMELMGLYPNLGEASEAEKQTQLAAAIDSAAVSRLPLEALTSDTRQTLDLFVLLHQAGKTYTRDTFGCLIASMTQAPSDVLTFLWLSRLAAALSGDGTPSLKLPIVPLFETIGDLHASVQTLEGLWANPVYRQHLRDTGDVQTAMIGYSDSTKDGGYLAANWALYDAQASVAASAKRHGLKVSFFHGRGGALGRGGGPAARGIVSLPPESIHGQIRITEQGEVLAERYDDPQIAYRHLEQVTWATLGISGRSLTPATGSETEPVVDGPDSLPPKWHQAMSVASDASLEAYRSLRLDDAFIDYFQQCTPISIIESLAIGSRPARRRTKASLENLRAIPYTFSWNQTRHGLTAFFGLGTGLTAANEQLGDDWATLRAMFKGWPFFRAVIHNAELAVAKCDLEIAHAYADLADNPEGAQAIWTRIRDEYEATRHAILKIADRDDLLGSVPWLQRSIQVRNPYVDPLNFIQVELLRRRRQGDESPELLNALRLTVQGIAAGLRTTG